MSWNSSTTLYSVHACFVSTSHTGGYFTNCFTHTHDWDICISSVSKHTHTFPQLTTGGGGGDTCLSDMCQDVLRPAVWLADSCQASGPVRSSAVGTDARPSAWVDTSLPHHLSRRMKCAVVSWQCSPKCQPGVTNPCRPAGPHRPGSVGRCPGSDKEPGTCHGNNNRWSTTGALPSCLGWLELVGSARGWLLSLLAVNLTKTTWPFTGWKRAAGQKWDIMTRKCI